MKDQRWFKKLIGMALVLALVAEIFVVPYKSADAAEQMGNTVSITNSALKKAKTNIKISLNGVNFKKKAFVVNGKVEGKKEKVLYVPSKEFIESVGGTYARKGDKVTVTIADVKLTFKVNKNSYTLAASDENGKKIKYTLKCGKAVKKGSYIYVPMGIVDAICAVTKNDLEVNYNSKKKSLDLTIMPEGTIDTPVVGGWEDPETPEVPEKVVNFLDETNKANKDGKKIVPVVVLKQQISAGIGYKLLCTISDPAKSEDEVFGIVYVFVDLEDNMYITLEMKTDIPTNINNLPGGWSLYGSAEFPKEYLDAFNDAVSQLDGVEYKPVSIISTQVVNGINLCILCTARVIYPGAEPYHVLVYAYVNPVTQKAEIKNFATVAGTAQDDSPTPDEVPGNDGNESDVPDFGAVEDVDYMRLSGNFYSVNTFAGLKKVLYTEEKADGSFDTNIAGISKDITVDEEIHSLGYVELFNGAVITIEKGGVLEASVRISNGCKIIVKSGGALMTTMGGNDCIQNYGEIIVEEGGKLKSQMGGVINNEKTGKIVLDGSFDCGCVAYEGETGIWFRNEGVVEGKGIIAVYGQKLDDTELDLRSCADEIIKMVGDNNSLEFLVVNN